MRVFDNDVYEQQRLNIERLAKEHPDNWFYESQMDLEPNKRTGFAPISGNCYYCHRNIIEGNNAITLKELGDYIITGCPHCHHSFCD